MLQVQFACVIPSALPARLVIADLREREIIFDRDTRETP